MDSTGLKFPLDTQTRAGTKVTLWGYDGESSRPWYGAVIVNLGEATIKQPFTWLPTGKYANKETETSLDITIPIIIGKLSK